MDTDYLTMSSRVLEYAHVFPSWEVYPRIHYFHRRFRDLLARYKRVTGALPKYFHDGNRILELDEILDTFERGVEVKVIGTDDINDNDLVVSTVALQKKPQEAVRTPKTSVYICNVNLNNLGDEGVQDIINIIRTIAMKFPKIIVSNMLLIRCKTSIVYSTDENNVFRTAIINALHVDSVALHVHPGNILIDTEDSNLKMKVSEALEMKIVTGFLKISSHLQLFELTENRDSSDIDDILKDTTVIRSIYGFLRNGQNIFDISSEVMDQMDDEKFLNSAIWSLCRVIKCSSVRPLAEKYNLQTWICNRLLHEIEFENAMADSISMKTRNELNEMVSDELSISETDRWRHQKSCMFDFLLYPLQTDLKQVFKDAEKKLSSMQYIYRVMRRLLFETNGYIKQTTIEQVRVEQREQLAPKITESLRQGILAIKGVYGLGTIYNKLEIHLDTEIIPVITKLKSEDKQLETDASQGKEMSDTKFDETVKYKKQAEFKTVDTEMLRNISKVKSEIASIIRKHHFHEPYTVKSILNKPMEMNGTFEPGDKLLSPSGRPKEFNIGTVGGFVMSEDGTLYGLTCAHVIGQTRKVYIYKDGLCPFSTCQKIVGTGQDKCKLIDIAAVELITSLQTKCKNSLEGNCGRVAKVQLTTETPVDLIGRYVHKFGAMTGVTKGTIMTVDYSQVGPHADDYIVVVDALGIIPTDFSADFGLLKNLSPNNERDHHIATDTTRYEQSTHANTAQESEAHASVHSNAHMPKETIHVADGHPEHKRRKMEHINGLPNLILECVNTSNGENPSQPESIGEIQNTADSHVADANMCMDIICSVEEQTISAIHEVRGADPGYHHTRQTEVIHNRELAIGYTNNVTLSARDTHEMNTKHVVLYVRDIKGLLDINDTHKERSDNVFAEQGDSGSVICTPDLFSNELNCVAVSMLSAGDFQIDGHIGVKSMSFLLRDGLAKLSQHCEVTF